MHFLLLRPLSPLPPAGCGVFFHFSCMHACNGGGGIVWMDGLDGHVCWPRWPLPRLLSDLYSPAAWDEYTPNYIQITDYSTHV